MSFFHHGDAQFTPDKRYRHWLSRWWNSDSRTVGFVMLNPSKADGNHDDNTVKLCGRYARRWGFDSLIVLNCFQLVSTDPLELTRVKDPIGPRADEFIVNWARKCELIVAGWGANTTLQKMGRAEHVTKLILNDVQKPIHALGVSKDGSPRHPLYMPKEAKPNLWRSL